MKYYEYDIESDKIEFHNSYLGIEKVLINGKKVSRKFSITGTEHHLKINTTEIILTTEYASFKDRKFNLYLEKNEKLIDVKYIKLHKRYRLLLIGIVMSIGIWLIKLFKSI